MSDDCLYKISKFLPMSLYISQACTISTSKIPWLSYCYFLFSPSIALLSLLLLLLLHHHHHHQIKFPRCLLFCFFPLIGFVFQDQKNKTINYIHYSFYVICFSWLGSLMLFIWEVHLMLELQNWLIYNFYLPLFQG